MEPVLVSFNLARRVVKLIQSETRNGSGSNADSEAAKAGVQMAQRITGTLIQCDSHTATIRTVHSDSETLMEELSELHLHFDAVHVVLKTARQCSAVHFIRAFITALFADESSSLLARVVSSTAYMRTSRAVFAVIFLLDLAKLNCFVEACDTFNPSDPILMTTKFVDEMVSSPHLLCTLLDKDSLQCRRKTFELLEYLSQNSNLNIQHLLSALYPFAESLVRSASENGPPLPPFSNETCEFWFDSKTTTIQSSSTLPLDDPSNKYPQSIHEQKIPKQMLDRQSCRHLISISLLALDAWMNHLEVVEESDLVVTIQEENDEGDITRSMLKYDRLLKDQECNLLEIVFAIASDDDSFLMNVMLRLIPMTKSQNGKALILCNRYTRKLASCVASLSSHAFFFKFLESTGWDLSALIDLLISSETKFLEFLINYTKQSGISLVHVKVVSLIGSLADRVEELNKVGVFPYNASVLVRRLRLFSSSRAE
ncbi:hypothetical protein HDU78_000984 [Chytriomyces hyalinus]|nr:hypothetical protein HDU78_000984 [Chytriomyces hyalinus]